MNYSLYYGPRLTVTTFIYLFSFLIKVALTELTKWSCFRRFSFVVTTASWASRSRWTDLWPINQNNTQNHYTIKKKYTKKSIQNNTDLIFGNPCTYFDPNIDTYIKVFRDTIHKCIIVCTGTNIYKYSEKGLK